MHAPSSGGSSDLREVFRASGEFEAQLIRSLLLDSGIDSAFEGESIRLTHGISINELGMVRILVRSEDFEEAKRIIEDAAANPLPAEDE
ncbi:MAG TPA: DUF2007 domain-containing protein [Acidobacteriota bacterium]|nr:DUF2007 domain-containing protein [Acidobacteriota bacterium]